MKFLVILLAAAGAAAQSTTVSIKVGNQPDTTLGLKGRLQLAMSTSFQLAGWNYGFFDAAPDGPAQITALSPFHTRVQVVSDGIPLSTTAHNWNFDELNTMLSPIQGTGDHSPEMQLGTAPAYMSDSQGHILPASFGDFAAMSANIVRYYNQGGFTDAGVHYQSPTPYPITWWGIFNEPDINGVSAADYVALYNKVVPQMAQADPNIKFVALELAGGADPYIFPFLNGVTAPVDVVAKHFYSTCNQRDADQVLFSTVPGFASQIADMYQFLAINPALAGKPIWVTENNVNADYDQGNGISACNAPQKFVLDKRGSSAFFAAWRTLVFQQFGEVGTQALYHWSFGDDQEFGEVASPNGGPPSLLLSYWVDYYLSHWLPAPPGQDILQATATGCCATDFPHGWEGGGGLKLDTQTLAARNPDGSVVILMSNYALATTSSPNFDNNGAGAPRTFALDLSSLGNFTSATLVTLDANTPLPGGPVPQSLTFTPQMQVTLQGYGAAFLRLSNTQPNLPAAGVVNAATFTAGPVAPGEIVSLFGTGLGPATGGGPELTNPVLVSNSYQGVHVWFDGVMAPITYASAIQVNAVVPYSVAVKSTTTLQVEYLGAVTAPIPLKVVGTVPGIFTQNYGSGAGSVINVADNTLNSPAHPAAPGDWVSIYATGAGATTPAGVDGLVTLPPYPQVNATDVTVTIGDLVCNTNYAGGAPYFIAGLTQINAQIPAGAASGANPLTVKIGGVVSQDKVTIAVR